MYIIIIKSKWTSWAPVPNKPTVSVHVKQHFKNNAAIRAQELCESRGARPGLPYVPNKPTVSVDI